MQNERKVFNKKDFEPDFVIEKHDSKHHVFEKKNGLKIF